MLFGNGLSALLTLLGISGGARRALHRRAAARRRRRARRRLAARGSRYFGALGAGFMLLEVALLQRFVLLLGHPVYSLTVTLFSLLLGTGLGQLPEPRTSIRPTCAASCDAGAVWAIAVVALAAVMRCCRRSSIAAIPWPLPRCASLLAVALLVPAGVLLGIPLPAGMRLLARRAPQIVPWAWGMNGALSVVGATLAVFIAMNWGFSVTLLAGAAAYVFGSLTIARRAG